MYYSDPGSTINPASVVVTWTDPVGYDDHARLQPGNGDYRLYQLPADRPDPGPEHDRRQRHEHRRRDDDRFGTVKIDVIDPDTGSHAAALSDQRYWQRI